MANDVIVIGGGVAGASAAYRLARDGVGVTLVDAGHEGQATAAGAGIVSYTGFRQTSDEWRRFFQAATSYHRSLVEDLAERGETEIGYRVVGELIVSPGEDSEGRLAELARKLEEANAVWQDPQIGDVRLLTPGEARQFFPPLDPALGAVHVSGVARIDGRLLRDALQRTVVRLGGRVVTGPGAPAIEQLGKPNCRARGRASQGRSRDCRRRRMDPGGCGSTRRGSRDRAAAWPDPPSRPARDDYRGVPCVERIRL